MICYYKSAVVLKDQWLGSGLGRGLEPGPGFELGLGSSKQGGIPPCSKDEQAHLLKAYNMLKRLQREAEIKEPPVGLPELAFNPCKMILKIFTCLTGQEKFSFVFDDMDIPQDDFYGFASGDLYRMFK
jgi:hypothetical protein